MKENEILYGIDNKEYIIKEIKGSNIEVEYNREVLITKNAGLEKDVQNYQETLLFNTKDIGITIFFRLNDCYKTINDLLEDNLYQEYKENLYVRQKNEEQKRIEELEDIKKNAPEIEITNKEIDIKLLEYEDKELSEKEEKEFYEKESASYFARMDTYIDYYNKKYYGKYYISKATIKENIQRGAYDSSEGLYITPSELREMGMEHFIYDDVFTRGIYKEYKDGTYLIHWTSELANLYYDKENHTLQIGEGKKAYKYRTMLKRTFNFNPLTYNNTYIMNNTFYSEGTVDEFLLQVLKEKRNSDELTDIIYTIQSNQNKIIRTDRNEDFIVQGCAGSGKTMILLHRVAYLKYNNKLPQYSKIKIITPNSIFKKFISNLSNSLDIDEIEQITISNYYYQLNKKYINKYNNLISIKDKDEFKENSSNEENSFKLYVQTKKDKFKKRFEPDKMINENGIGTIDILYSEELLNFIQNEYNTIIQKEIEEINKLNLDDIDFNTTTSTAFDRLLYKLEKILKERNLLLTNKRREKEDCEKQLKNLQSNSNIFMRLISNNRISELQNRINMLKSRIDTIKNEIEKIEIVKKSIIENVYFSIDLYDVILEKVEGKFNIQFEKGRFTRIQLLLFLYINYLHYGSLIDSDELLCVDEAQDYNIIEYVVLKLVNNKAVMNLYGDVNQSIYSKGIKDWKQLKTSFNLNQYNINENYRNSKQITDFCNSIFEFNSLSMGIESKEVSNINIEQLQDLISRKIEEKRKIAIIAKNNAQLEKINNRCENEFVIYTTVPDAKGIEYDTVVVLENEMNKNEKYISYTRALNELYLLK